MSQLPNRTHVRGLPNKEVLNMVTMKLWTWTLLLDTPTRQSSNYRNEGLKVGV